MRWGFFAVILVFVKGIVAAEPQLSCEKNWGERTWEGVKFHRYHLRAEHFPPNKTYCLIVESFDGIRTETFSFTANQRGHLILKPPEDFEGEIYAICPAKRGERLTFWMKSEEDAYATQLIPFPLQMKSRKGVKLNLELRGEKGDQFLLMAEELQSCEEIELFLVIQEQRIPLHPEAVTEFGELSAMIDLPQDPHGGEAKLILKREKEEIVFPFQWGAPALKIVGACCFEIRG
jgi:hypothetical protein